MDHPGSTQSKAAIAHSQGLKVFVCYRRDDTAGFARALKTVLGQRFGPDRIFMDLDNIAPGELWEDVVQQAVSGCDALIALIGRQWVTARIAGGGRRLDDPVDPVRLEIEAALKEGLKVIPILLQGAKMPTADKLPPDLARLPGIQALAITDDWDAGVTKLMASLDRLLEKKEGSGQTRIEIDDVSASADPVAVVATPPPPAPEPVLAAPPAPGPEPVLAAPPAPGPEPVLAAPPTTAPEHIRDAPSGAKRRLRFRWILVSVLAAVTAATIAGIVWLPEKDDSSTATPSTDPGTVTGPSTDAGDEVTPLRIEFASGQSQVYRATLSDSSGPTDTATFEISDDGATGGESLTLRVIDAGSINPEGLPRSPWFVAPKSDQVIDIDTDGELDQSVWLGVDRALGWSNWWLDQFTPILPTDPSSPGDTWSSEGFTSIKDATGGVSWTASCTFVGWRTIADTRAAFVTCRFAQSWDYSYSFARIAELGGGPTQDLGSDNPKLRHQATATYELRAWLDAENSELIRSEGSMQHDGVVTYSGVPPSWEWSDEEEFSDAYTQVVERVD